MSGLTYSTFTNNAIQQYRIAALGQSRMNLLNSYSASNNIKKNNNDFNYFKPVDQVKLTDRVGQLSSKAYTELRGQSLKTQAQLYTSKAAPTIDQGYWGSEQTASRIIEFAKGLSGGNSERTGIIIDAVKKGFSDAQYSAGGELPEVSRKTRDTVFTELDAWAKSINS